MTFPTAMSLGSRRGKNGSNTAFNENVLESLALSIPHPEITLQSYLVLIRIAGVCFACPSLLHWLFLMSYILLYNIFIMSLNIDDTKRPNFSWSLSQPEVIGQPQSVCLVWGNICGGLHSVLFPYPICKHNVNIQHMTIMLSTVRRQQMPALQELKVLGKFPVTAAQFRWGLLGTHHY